MKKQLIFLYILLCLFLSILGYACYSLFTMEREPDVLPEYSGYMEYQEEVVVVEETSAEEDEAVYLEFDLEEMLQTNPDFDCWLMIPDTTISFPVVRTVDNFFYLDRDFSKNSSPYGCLFFDAASYPEAENRVIHGHNMGNGRQEMFSTLVEYQEQEYAEAHKYAYLSGDPAAPADAYEVFAVVNFNLAGYYPYDYVTPDFASEEEKASFVAYLREKSIYETDFVPESKLLILSTCNRQYGAANRLLICLGLLPSDS